MNANLAGQSGALDDAWWRFAACRGMDVFLPKRGSMRLSPSAERTAKSVCSECVVREQCLDAALKAGEEFGVWGGLNVKERQELAQERSRVDRLPRPS